MNSVVKIISVVMLASTVIGCSSMDMSKYLPDKKVDYQKKTSTAGHLEVPPDLSGVSDVGKGGAASGRVDHTTQYATSDAYYQQSSRSHVYMGLGRVLSGIALLLSSMHTYYSSRVCMLEYAC